MIMRVKRIFVASEILRYSTDSSSPWQNAALQALQKAREGGFELITSQQVLREYLVSNTQSQGTEKNGVPQSVLDQVRGFQATFTIVKSTEEVLNVLLEVMREIPGIGNHVYYANIVATMLVYRIEHLLTHNVKAYKCFSKKIHVVPLDKWVRVIK